ncbi:MAG: excinuclease ABC subunit C, partial [archaeon GW2011_AR13]
SYFQNKEQDEKTKAMISHINDVEFIVTDTEIESFLLENTLIKKHNPKYNINLKDSKRYAFIEKTNEEFPRLIIARTKDVEGKLFGPFISASMRDEIIYLLNKIFKLRTCKRLPKKVCLRYSLGLCSAPCEKKISKKDYLEDINSCQKILQGNIKGLSKELNEKMQEASNKNNFEMAMKLRDQINAIKILTEKQNVERQKNYDEDIINYLIRKDKVYLMLFNINKGVLENTQEFIFEYRKYFFEEFLSRYYSENQIPKVIILPKEIDESLIKYLELKRKQKIKIIIPKIGELKDLITFISHLSGTETVGSMVQYKDGISNKSEYRKFKIKGDYGIDDFASIEEIVYRRYYRIVKEGLKLPDLIIVDGGAGQLSFALKALEKLKIKIPVIGLAKKEEEIYLPNKDILRLNNKNKGLLLLISIRDEAHRFAISFQRLRRRKILFKK